MKKDLQKEFPQNKPRHEGESTTKLQPIHGQNRVPNEYVFRLHGGATQADLRRALSKESLAVRKIEFISKGTYLVVLSRDPGPAAIAKMASTYQAILTAQPNFIYQAN